MNKDLTQRLSEGISTFYRANMNRRTNFPIRSSEMGILIFIVLNAGDTGVRSVELSEYFGIRKSSVSAIITSLEKQGYIERTQSDDDKRNNPFFPTPKGVSLANEAFDEYHRVSKILIDKIGEAKCEEFLEVLSIATDIIQKADGEK